MIPDQHFELVKELSPSALAVSSSAHCASLLTRLNVLRSWIEAQSIAVTRRLDQLATATPGIFPEQILADATRVSLTKAMEPFQRAKAVELLPEFGKALASGAVNVDHLDVLARSVAGLDAPTTAKLADRDEFLVEVASRTTSGEFRRTLRDEIRRAQQDDGVAKTVTWKARQLKATLTGKGPTTLGYDLDIGVDEAPVAARFTSGAVTICLECAAYNGKTGADGKQFLGKTLSCPAPSACAGSPSGAFLD